MGKRLYIQLYEANTGNSLTLPINPENIDNPSGKDIKTYNLLNYGEVPVAGYSKLKKLTLNSLLPDTDSYFALLSSLVESLKHKPYTKEKSVNMLHEWAKSEKPIRVIIAGDAYENINLEFLMGDFVEGIRESNRDIISKIELIEYKSPANKTIGYKTDLKTIGSLFTNPINNKYKDKIYPKLKNRTIAKFIPKQITAQQGATLYKIAKLVYGEASAKSNKLAEINSIFDRNKDIAGQIIDMLPLEEDIKIKEAI